MSNKPILTPAMPFTAKELNATWCGAPIAYADRQVAMATAVWAAAWTAGYEAGRQQGKADTRRKGKADA